MNLEWRYWHRKGYWQIWKQLGDNGLMEMPTQARAIEVREIPPAGVCRFCGGSNSVLDKINGEFIAVPCPRHNEAED